MRPSGGGGLELGARAGNLLDFSRWLSFGSARFVSRRGESLDLVQLQEWGRSSGLLVWPTDESFAGAGQRSGNSRA